MTGRYSDYLVWDGDRLLARVLDHGGFCRVLREPCCTIGEFFLVLSTLKDFGFNPR